jgi:hypothetical protein
MRRRDILRSPWTLPIPGGALVRGSDGALAEGSNAVAAAAATSKTTFIQMIGLRSVRLISWPTISVPNTKAADAEPRIQPYSKGFPAI